ncbi:MAG: Ig-like domain-containing protein [Deltaproteobacteria bacterium]|nr:Ig-like domain-containing protein [Deltaproteobacteria bacterium]
MRVLPLLLFCLLPACFTPDRFATPAPPDQGTTPPAPSVNEEPAATYVTIDSITVIQGTSITLTPGQKKGLMLNVQLSDGTVYTNLTDTLNCPYPLLSGKIIWYSNDSDTVTVNHKGRLLAVQAGTTNILVTLQNISTAVFVEVRNNTPAQAESETAIEETSNEDTESLMAVEETLIEDTEPAEVITEETDEPVDTPFSPLLPEPPDDEADYFLNDDDIFTTNFGPDAGFGLSDFPGIIFGPPGGTYDVVSLGTDGEIKIELNGYLIVDGPGPDFTVFENPFPGWRECAEVAVSADDVHYATFDCTQYDAGLVFKGCAGVHPVKAGLDVEEYLDPSLSGGDPFDISDLEAPPEPAVKYIKIRDIGLCAKNRAEANTGGLVTNGFDLDAVALINGVNEF